MVKVGITGGIGSGKSLVCKIFSLLGVPVYYSDERAKYILNNNTEVIKKLTAKFGENLYTNGELNRAFLANIIFNNKEAINFVNSIVHPAVGIDFADWTETLHASLYCMEEAALLFESGSFKQFDLIITVVSPEQMRIKRVMERDKVQKDDVISRMRNQWNDEKKIELSDFVINNGITNSLMEQVLEIHNKILTGKYNE
jgi:dephospho-CoA kinase